MSRRSATVVIVSRATTSHEEYVGTVVSISALDGFLYGDLYVDICMGICMVQTYDCY